MAAHLHPRQGHILYMSSQYDTDIGTQEQFAKEGGVLMAAEPICRERHIETKHTALLARLRRWRSLPRFA